MILPCHFGLEKVTKYELIKLGFFDEKIKLSDGEAMLECNIDDIPRLNINLRTAERVLILLGEKECKTFEDLYQFILSIPIEDYIDKNDIFLISKANQDKNSVLHSSTSIQSIAKKAMVDRLKKIYNVNILPENGIKYSFRIKFNKNICRLLLDTTGDSLHKRGYRIRSGLAPIEETLAASIIMLSPFKKGRILLDPFCGSGTFCIEGAMITHNIAPGINRIFSSERWTHVINKNVWDIEYKKAKELIIYDNEKLIFGSDIDKEMIDISIENAKRANVDKYIDFKISDISNVKINKPYGFIITNPPYGERLEDKNSISKIYDKLGIIYRSLDNWSMYMITSYDKSEEHIRKADKNRKIYNGMIKTYLYQFMGEKPKD